MHRWILSVGVFPRGVTPTSKTCVRVPFPDGDARKDTRFILVRAREGPTSSRGGVFVLSCTKVLVQGRIQAGMDG